MEDNRVIIPQTFFSPFRIQMQKINSRVVPLYSKAREPRTQCIIWKARMHLEASLLMPFFHSFVHHLSFFLCTEKEAFWGLDFNEHAERRLETKRRSEN